MPKRTIATRCAAATLVLLAAWAAPAPAAPEGGARRSGEHGDTRPSRPRGPRHASLPPRGGGGGVDTVVVAAPGLEGLQAALEFVVTRAAGLPGGPAITSLDRDPLESPAEFAERASRAQQDADDAIADRAFTALVTFTLPAGYLLDQRYDRDRHWFAATLPLAVGVPGVSVRMTPWCRLDNGPEFETALARTAFTYDRRGGLVMRLRADSTTAAAAALAGKVAGSMLVRVSGAPADAAKPLADSIVRGRRTTATTQVVYGIELVWLQLCAGDAAEWTLDPVSIGRR